MTKLQKKSEMFSIYYKMCTHNTYGSEKKKKKSMQIA